VLKRATDRTKDQNYYLASISEESLARSLFPIGHLLKSEVRELAKKFALPTAERPESMGICFIGEKTKFSSWIGV
jgi:tRNA-specific 2-thiouridylase